MHEAVVVEVRLRSANKEEFVDDEFYITGGIDAVESEIQEIIKEEYGEGWQLSTFHVK